MSIWVEDDRDDRGSRGSRGARGSSAARGRETGRRRRRPPRRRRGGLAVLLALLVVGGLLAGGVLVAAGALSSLGDRFGGGPPDYAGEGTGTVRVEVKQGSTIAGIGRTLKAAGVVRSVDAFVAAAGQSPDSSRIQPGFYNLRARMSAAAALAVLTDPAQRLRSVVAVPEGLRLDETLRRVATKGKLPLPALEAAVKKPAGLGLPAYAKGNPEGFLFPATYELAPEATAAGTLKQMVDRFKVAAREVGLESAQVPGGLGAHDIVVVASIVEGEARRPEDFGKVARVVYNRLAKGMPLQMDSTVNYALKADKTIVTFEDLEVESAYNTYARTGLPPGPISSPGEAALRAAIAPPAGDWLYFVTTNPTTGETKFTGSYAQFLRFKAELKTNQ